MNLFARTPRPTSPETALPGRSSPAYTPPARNIVLDAPLTGPWPEGTRELYVAMGCFWGVERIFWRIPGVVGTAVGYTGGYTPHPTYEEVCTAMTGHAEAALVAYDPAVVSADELFKAFWENHDPTTKDRQGNDVGSQYRSAIWWTTEEQREAAERTRATFQAAIDEVGGGAITTEIEPFGDRPFYAAEDYHQQYLEKNPAGYCNHGPNGLTCNVA
ncbi:peptide-methionine (S)-S-oxide reductase MsrA [Georgenia sp. Z1491]|uniref:peptide-methionine (S)-S-oxide reductase MsrA n=1 Tax=Georgenia sp. Z1491 TaxID=3416707 RepID=UPI003CE718F3